MAFANFLWHHSEFDEKRTKERKLAKIRSTKQTRKLERFLIKLRTNSQNWNTFCSSQVVVTRPCIRLCYTVEFESYLQYITSIEMASINICMGLSKRICFKDHSVTVLQGSGGCSWLRQGETGPSKTFGTNSTSTFGSEASTSGPVAMDVDAVPRSHGESVAAKTKAGKRGRTDWPWIHPCTGHE